MVRFTVRLYPSARNTFGPGLRFPVMMSLRYAAEMPISIAVLRNEDVLMRCRRSAFGVLMDSYYAHRDDVRK